MKVGIYSNTTASSNYSNCISVVNQYFIDHSIEYKNVNSALDLFNVDVLLVLGGDGTILMLADECAKRNIKIIGVNFGHLGFLAEFEHEKLVDALKIISSKNYKTLSRTMLEVSFANKSFIALNDVVLQRCTSGRQFSNTVHLRAEIDGTVVDNYSSDGLIVSTPTGSTAYSLSAGGSILSPDINAFIMTPICAHSLHSRPIVYNDNSILQLYPSKQSTLNLVVDGKIVGTLNNGEVLTVRKSVHKLNFITANDNNFYNKLLMKLNIWSK